MEMLVYRNHSSRLSILTVICSMDKFQRMWQSPGWGGALPWEPMRWIINREGVLLTEKVVLWARVDLFPEEPEAVEEPASEEDIEDPSPLLDKGVEVEE